MYAFARQPKWIAGHILAAVLLVSFAAAAVWQLSRHQARVERNDRIAARVELAPLGSVDLVTADDDSAFRRATVSGVWRGAETVLIRNRSQESFAGCHVVTPLGIDTAGEQRAIAVTIGWLPERLCTIEDIRAALGNNPVAVEGRVRSTQTRGWFGPKDPAEGALDTLARVDVERLDQQTSDDLAPVFVEATAIEPSVDLQSEFIPAPAQDNGPHLGYAGQWAMFFLVGAVGYPLVLRRQARVGAREDIS